MGADREPGERKYVVGGNYPLWKVWINQLRRSNKKHRFYWCRPAAADFQYYTMNAPVKAPRLFISLFFSMLSGTLKLKKSIMDGTGWCPPSQRTHAQLQASLKDMTDCPRMAKFKSDTAAAAFWGKGLPMHTFLIKLILKIKTQVSKRQLCIWLHAESLIAAAVNTFIVGVWTKFDYSMSRFLTYSALSDVILNLWLLMFVFISLIRPGSIQNHWRKKKATHRNLPPSSYFEISMLDKRNIDFFF